MEGPSKDEQAISEDTAAASHSTEYTTAARPALSLNDQTPATVDDATSSSQRPIVRFVSGADEIPVQSPEELSEAASNVGQLSPPEYHFIRQASAATQQRRLSHFDYQPLSLPPSRVSLEIEDGWDRANGVGSFAYGQHAYG